MKSLKSLFACKGKGCARKCRGEVPAAKTKNHWTMEKEKPPKTERMKMQTTKALVGTFGLFGKIDLPAKTQTKKVTHMQLANQGITANVSGVTVIVPVLHGQTKKNMQQPASQIYAPKLWAGPNEPQNQFHNTLEDS